MCKAVSKTQGFSLIGIKTLLLLIFYITTAWAQTDIKTQSEIEQHEAQAKQQIQKTIVNDAVAAIEEIKKIISYLSSGQEKEATSAIERATGKIDILIARHPEKAMLPVGFEVKIIDTAPLELRIIKEIGKLADKEVRDKNYPDGRVLLNVLRSEININTSHSFTACCL